MSRILCVIDGMTDFGFSEKEYPNLSSMRLKCHIDTCMGGEAETLRCILGLLGIKQPDFLRGYAEALGAGIAVEPDDLILRGSWFKTEFGRCLFPCSPTEIKRDSRFRSYSLGGYKSLLIFPKMADTVGEIETRIPVSGKSVRFFRPVGNAVLSEIFDNNISDNHCLIMWGQSVAAKLPPLGVSAAVVCRKSTVKGIARLLNMELIEVSGATADVDTDLKAKTQAALSAAESNSFVLLHINGADEAAHQCDYDEKIRFLREIDDIVLSRLLKSEHEIIVAADHGCDPKNGLHIGGAQPIFTNR